MTLPVLHHFDASPFAEKVRIALGIKQLRWGSVQTPMIPPRPELAPLNGGYRRTPTLQIGADVYCDTRLILPELDARYPERPLATGGIADMLAAWSDGVFFPPGAALSMALNDGIPEPLLKDRTSMFTFMDFDELQSAPPHMFGQFAAQTALVEQQLADGRAFLAGDTVSALDASAYHPLWMVRANVPGMAPHLAPFAKVADWLSRMDAIGHGDPQDMDPADALSLAREHEPSDAHAVTDNPQNLSAGDAVTVTPTDYGTVPVSGQLLGLTLTRITLRRHDARVGRVNTHFPRAGFRLAPA